MSETETVDAPDDTIDRTPNGWSKKRKITVAAIVVVLLITSPLIYYYTPQDQIYIDGLFSDWSGVPKFTDILEGQENSDIDIAEYTVKDNEDSLNFYLKVKGRVMSGGATSPGADSMQIFLDTDRNSETGYQVYCIGADYMVNMTGWGGDVHAGRLLMWSGPGGMDLINFQSRSKVRVATSVDKLEAQIWLRAINVSSRTTPVRVAMRTVDSLGNEDWTDAAINQFPPALAFKYISGQTSNSFSLSAIGYHDNITLDRLRIRFEDHRGNPALGRASISVGGRNNQGTGPAQVSDVTFQPPVKFTPGVTQTFQITTSSLAGAVAVRPALLYSNDIEARAENYHNVEVSIKPSPDFRYVNVAPLTGGDIRIDGNFDDWNAFGIKGEPMGDVGNHNLASDGDYPYITKNRNVDINGLQVKMTPTAGPTKINFQVSTVGQILNGLVVDNPTFPGISEPGMGGFEPPENIYLEDRVLVYIDRDPTNDPEQVTGALVIPNDPTFGADVVISVAGKFGRVLNSLSEIQEWTVTGWQSLQGQIPSAASDFHRLEISVSLGTVGMNPTVTPETYIIVTDWRGNYDDTLPYANR